MSEKIKQYWDERAKERTGSTSATTDDVYLRELEIKSFIRVLEHGIASGTRNDKDFFGPPLGGSILDIGCGDGYTTINIAKHFPQMQFTGVDYSANMIENAKANAASEKLNISFAVADATRIAESFGKESFDVILTDRCLINLESSDKQYDAIRQISGLLKPSGSYIGIENFIDGQDNLTAARVAMGLPEIPVRWHNLFFNEKEFTQNTAKWFSELSIDDFSSAYYYATRVLYSAMCKVRNEEPDYQHDIHRLAVDLPSIGKNFSPIRMFVLRK